jgi:hypothetical protein
VVNADLAVLNSQLQHGNLSQRAAAADQLANAESTVSSEFRFTVLDELLRPIGEIGDNLLDSNGSDPRNAVPTATIKTKGSSTLVPELMKCSETLRAIMVETAGIRMAYYVDIHEYDWDKDAYVSTSNCLGIWDILNYMQIWPDWLMPIQIQVVSYAVFVGPLVTVIENMIAECALRIQSGIWQFVNTFFSFEPNMEAWFSNLIFGNPNLGQRLKTPVYVVRTNPWLDTSPLFVRTVRMESCGKVVVDITRPYGVDVRVDLWLPGDPQPDAYANLSQPTYVVTVKDRSQVTGPTGTVLDSIIKTVVDFTGGLSKVLASLMNPQGEYAPSGVFIAPVLGVHFVKPYAILVAPEPGRKSSLTSCKIADHTPKGWRIIIGGKSPKWINDLINALFAWLIDAISIFIGIAGLSGLLDGFLNDAFFAFQLWDDTGRRAQVGPYHPGVEAFIPTVASPYNIEALFTFIEALWDTRGYTAGIATFRNDGSSYVLGRDIFRGGLVSILYLGGTKLFTDYIENVLWRVSPKVREVTITVGDGKALAAPIQKLQKFITGVQEAWHVLTLAPNS